MDITLNKDTRLCISLSARPSNFGTRFQNYLYRELGLNFVYKAFGITDNAGAVTGIRALGIRGSAVSMPFKEECMKHLDELDISARNIGAVNTIVNNDGHLKGYNTDTIAVLRLLREREISPETRFALAGSGGMAKAVACALRDAGIRNGIIISRNQQTGAALAQKYGYEWMTAPSGTPPEFLINTTPLGMTGAPEATHLPFPEEWVRKSSLVFDVVAHPAETPLIQLARRCEKKVITGAEVVVLQAVEQFALYTGVRPDVTLVERAAEFALS